MLHRVLHDVGWLALSFLEVYALVRAAIRVRGVERSLAWIFAILAFPLLGALAFLLLANPSIRRTTRRKRRSTARLRSSMALRKAARLASRPTPQGQLLRLAEQVTGLPPSSGNRVELLAGNERAFERLEAALRSARRSIWAEYYIVLNDETGRRFLDLLAERARAGAEVRLLYDAVGSLSINARLLEAIRASGGKTAAFLPLNPLKRRWSVHLRNHRKIVVVDGEVGFTGGMNVGDGYSGRALLRPVRRYRDNHLEVRGPAVGDLAQTFAEDWSFATGGHLHPMPHPSPVRGGRSLVAVVPSGPDQELNASAEVHFGAIGAARKRLYLTSPYFIPDDPTLRALVNASLRGVDVRILLPGRSDLVLLGPAIRSYFPALLGGGVRIFEYRFPLHAKTMVVDGSWGIVGSANVDIRSFRLNFELGALVVDPAFARTLERRFLADLEGAVEVTPRQIARRGFLDRLAYGAARLLSPLL